ncbi:MULTISPECIES: ankyrin repeat domain-containing protein [Xanthomonas]|uniref:Ankyrin repeat domain-containing protein n=4 Tax=Xanthomonas TaxID=338 RepID=A0AB33FEM5_XANCI|nr:MULTISPECIES: ankyrin repeat domain-containing protein [Xanthomonas]ATS86832.1 ankyrin repeat domain-containing protein [Xanthomonas citri pv. phaseoli var. fuscans]WOP59005.1 ankyrin repeat domain-containing protein [Xanthomonas euvesicatoria]SOO23791.1 putative phospholipase accessory protein [Xanthomonas phaseoli pv. phaseoli]
MSGASGAVDASRVFPRPEDAELARAGQAGDLDRLEALVAGGANPSARGLRGVSVLQWAVLHRARASMNKLLALGADATNSDEDGQTVVHYAAGMDDPGFLDDLIEADVDLNVRDARTGQTPIFAALQGDRTPQLEALLRVAREGKVDLALADYAGNSLLHAAAKVNDTRLVLELLERGVSPTALNKQGVDFMRYLRNTPTEWMDSQHQTERAAIESLMRPYTSGP